MHLSSWVSATTHPCVWGCVWFNWWTIIRLFAAHHMGMAPVLPQSRTHAPMNKLYTGLFMHRHTDICTRRWPYCFLFSCSTSHWVVVGVQTLFYNHIKWKYNLHTSTGRLRFPSLSDSSKWVGGIFRLVFLSFAHQQPVELKLSCSLVWNKNCR